MNSRLRTALDAGRFVVTAEVSPPRDGSSQSFAMDLVAARHVTAVNVTDNPGARLAASPVAAAALAVQAGVEPVVQLVCRNRNLLATLSDVLGAWVVGARSIVALSGDAPSTGEFPMSTDVTDLDSIGLIRIVKEIAETGALPNGRVLVDAPQFLIGTTDAPLAAAPEHVLPRLFAKVEAGADFVQTQPVFDMHAFKGWLRVAGDLPERVKVIAGVAIIRSAAGARRWQALPGSAMPDSLIDRFTSAESSEEFGIQHALETIESLRALPSIAGVHLMSVGWRFGLEQVIERSGLSIPLEPGGATIATFDQPPG